MYPEINIFGLHVHSYGLMIAIGICIGFGLCLYYAPRHNLSRDRYMDLMICLLLGGFGGAKLLGLIVNLGQVLDGTITLWQALSVTVVYGGIVGGMIVCGTYCLITKTDFWSYADLALPCAAITHGIGRIGCFLAGCCYGMEYNGFGAVVFSNSIYAPNGVSLFPSQIVSSVFLITYGIIALILCNRKKHKRGDFATTYFIVYGLARTIIEFFRGDAERGFVFALSTSQFISIFFVAVGICLKIYLAKHRNTKIDANTDKKHKKKSNQ
jgi:phosphatidylglycerol:prolipoprotein diacylglycerol transferase